MSRMVFFEIPNPTSTSATNLDILIPPFDVRHLDAFSFVYQNNFIGVNLTGMTIQAAAGDTTSFTSQANVAPDWVDIPTSTIANRANLASTNSFRTPLVNNCYGYLRILGRTAVSASAGGFVLKVEGRHI